MQRSNQQGLVSRVELWMVIVCMGLLCLAACSGFPPKDGNSSPSLGKGGIIRGVLTSEGFSTSAAPFHLFAAPVGIPDAGVYLFGTNVSTQTDAQGKFELKGVPPGKKHTLIGEATNEKGESIRKITEVPAVAAGEFLDLPSLLLNKTVFLTGQVNLKGKEDHSGISVGIPSTPFWTMTDTSGNFVIPGVPGGSDGHEIEAHKTGYKSTKKGVKPSATESAIRADLIILEPESQQKTVGQSVTKEGTGFIKGQITNGGNPLAGAVIALSVGGSSTISDKDGQYLLGNIAPGKYELLVTRAGFNVAIEEIEILSGGTESKDISLQSNVVVLGQISGTVLDQDGKPVRTVAILTNPNTSQTITDNGGKFNLTQIYPGDYILIGIKPSIGEVKKSISVGRDKNKIQVTLQFGKDTLPSSSSQATPAVTPKPEASKSGHSESTQNAPTITGFNPTSGGSGAPVIISGDHFTGVKSVQFNGVEAKSFSAIGHQITAIVANGSSSGKITVVTATGTATSPQDFVIRKPGGSESTAPTASAQPSANPASAQPTPASPQPTVSPTPTSTSG